MKTRMSKGMSWQNLKKKKLEKSLEATQFQISKSR